MTTDDPALATLRRAMPVPDAAVPADVGDAMADLAHAVSAGDLAPAPRRRRRGRRTTLVLVAACLVVPAAGAGAYLVSAHTGVFGKPGMTENDTTEFLDTGAPDFPQVVRTLEPRGLPVPAGWDWGREADLAVRRFRTSPDGSGVVVQETGVSSRFAYRARCAWTWALVRRTRAGDAAGAAAALAVMRGSVDWPLVVATDGGGVRDAFRRIDAAASRGDLAPALRDLDLNCGTEGFEAIR